MRKPTKPIKKVRNTKKTTTRGTKPPKKQNLSNSNKIKRPGDGLTEAQKNELAKLSKKITKTAKNVVKDYKNTPSEVSGSVIQINQDSPFLDEDLTQSQWDKTINNLPIRQGKKFPKPEKQTKSKQESLTPKIKRDKPGWAR